MSEKIDRRVRKTKEQLRKGLAELMNTKSIREITVKELVDKVDINRSTFYLHYTDIYQMLKSIENELLEEIMNVIRSYPEIPLKEDNFPFIADIFQILDENREICCALLGNNGDMAFVHRIETVIAENSLHLLKNRYPDAEEELRYAYSFCLSGCVGMIKSWLINDHKNSPEHMAAITSKMVSSATKSILIR